MTAVKGANVFVTGGSRGIGEVYATARDPRSVTHPDAVPVALEVTDPASVAAAAAKAGDATVLINNAGASVGAYEVLADDISRQVKAGLAGDLADLYAPLAK
nr:hypothetical protein [Streptomyces acidiscabies]